jgi:transposase
MHLWSREKECMSKSAQCGVHAGARHKRLLADALRLLRPPLVVFLRRSHHWPHLTRNSARAISFTADGRLLQSASWGNRIPASRYPCAGIDSTQQQRETCMALFVGLDVSLKTVSICIVKADGSVVWEGKALSEPAALIKVLARRRRNIELVGIEACPLSEWLYGALIDSGFPMICIETRHAQRFLSSRPNKTDRSDARGIADMMRLGHYRPVHVKSRESQLLRTTLIARRNFVTHMLAIEQTIRGLLKVYGLKLGQVHRCTFAAKVVNLLEDKPELRVAIEPLLEARNLMRRQHVLLDRHLAQVARKDEVCRRLMTISGVGPIVSLAFKATVDDPTRFKNSKAVAAHLGLTPRVYQSGELDLSGNISKCGDRFMRHALYEAANSHLRISKKWSSLRAWGLKLGERVGMKKACVAVARKLAIIMHRMWLNEEDFRCRRQTALAAR